MNYSLIKKKKERYFKTDIVASYVEVCNLSNCKFDEILEFASFITGEKIDINNLAKYRDTIMNILREQYPDLKRNIYLTTNTDVISHDYLLGNEYLYASNNECLYNLNAYKEAYGEYMLIKSINRDKVKTLKKI